MEKESEPGGWDEVWPETPEMAQHRIDLVVLIEAGHYREAIHRLSTDHPSLVQSVPSLVFMLSCRHFIEMVRNNEYFFLFLEIISLIRDLIVMVIN